MTGKLRVISILTAIIGMSHHAMAQDVHQIHAAPDPLVLKSRGSFFVGGELVEQSYVELGSLRPADKVTVNQMFVEFMIPQGTPNVPVIMIHGAGLSGHSYDTTADGRMGWYEYFVRASHPVYVIDQVGRGRSGFNQAVFNDVGAGKANVGAQPKMRRMGDHYAAWINFRFGPEDGVAFTDSQFPTESVRELSQQGIPDLADPALLDENYKALGLLASQLGGAILMGHSQSGAYPLEVALKHPDPVKAIIMVEPGSCENERLSEDDIRVLSSIPLLVVYGDHLSAPTFVPGPGWQERFNACERLISRVQAAKGRAAMLHPPALGIHGNSHLIMQDKNNLQIADLILKWLDQSLTNRH